MDNFKSHIEGVELAPPPSNIQIQWLPANSTSLYQPFDQGIIQNLKIHYWRYWLRFMIQGFENNTDPFTAVLLYHAVHWVLQVWNYDISSTTIYNCFQKSTVIQPKSQTYQWIHSQTYQAFIIGLGRQVKSEIWWALATFLTPLMRILWRGSNEDTLQSIIAYHTSDGSRDTMEEPQSDIEEGTAPIVVPSLQQALEGLCMLLCYKEHCKDTRIEDIRALERLERELASKELNSRSQGTLDS